MLAALSLFSSLSLALSSTGSFNASSFLVTMYAADPFSNGLDLTSALSASQQTGFTIFNANSDITFGENRYLTQRRRQCCAICLTPKLSALSRAPSRFAGRYSVGELVSGIQGSQKAGFADLGLEQTIHGKDDCNTAGGGQNFASLHIANKTLRIIDTCKGSNGCPQTFRELPGISRTLEVNVSALASIKPVVGHVYILRIVDDDKTRAMFKILVVDVHPLDASVTFRYGIMDFDQTEVLDCCNPDNAAICPSGPRNLVLTQGPPGPRGTQPSPSPSPSPAGPGPSVDPVGVGGVVAAAVASTVASLGLAAVGAFFCLGPRRRTLLMGTPETALLKPSSVSHA